MVNHERHNQGENVFVSLYSALPDKHFPAEWKLYRPKPHHDPQIIDFIARLIQQESWHQAEH